MRTAKIFAVLGVLLALFGLWLISNAAYRSDGVFALVVGVLWVVTSWSELTGRRLRGAGLVARIPKRLKASLGRAMWALIAFGALLPTGEGTPLWWLAMALVVVPLTLTAVVWLWRGPPLRNLVQRLGEDALVLEPPAPGPTALRGLSYISLSIGFGLATYLFIRGPRLEWDDFLMVLVSPILALVTGLLGLNYLLNAAPLAGRLRLDATGIHPAKQDSILWSDITAAKLRATDLVLTRRAPSTSIVAGTPHEVRIDVPSMLTEDDEAAIREFLGRHVPA